MCLKLHLRLLNSKCNLSIIPEFASKDTILINSQFLNSQFLFTVFYFQFLINSFKIYEITHFVE